MSDSERGRIIDTVFERGGDPFTASFIAHEAEVSPRVVYEVVALMDCVKETGSVQGKRGMVRSYEVTGIPPESCITCSFNSRHATSCNRAPIHREDSNTGRPSPQQIYDEMCEEARTGRLTDAAGNLIATVDG